MKRTRSKKGFSLLLSVLVGSLLISVGLGIFNLTFKESIISASGRESTSALFAADSGIECGLYYDVSAAVYHNNPNIVFGTTTDANDIRDFIRDLLCNGRIPYSATVNSPDDFNSTTTLRYGDPSDTGLCVDIEIGKHDIPHGSLSTLSIIQARGYNTCDTNNPRRVERGLYIKY